MCMHGINTYNAVLVGYFFFNLLIKFRGTLFTFVFITSLFSFIPNSYTLFTRETIQSYRRKGYLLLNYFKALFARYQSTISKSLFFLSANPSIVFGAGTITLSPGCQLSGIAHLFSSDVCKRY